MVSLIWAAVAASFGLLVYVAVPFVAAIAPIETRRRIGNIYFKMMARSLKQFAPVRRVLSGYDVLAIDVDAEKKLLKVTLSSSLVGSDKEFQFSDPDNRIKRLFGKPVALAFEVIPAAVDAELAEIGYWLRQKDMDEGLWDGELDEPESVSTDPYVPMKDTLRWVDPKDAFELVPNAVNPENITTAVELTRERYSKYGSRVGLEETIGVIMGFIAGVGAVVVIRYLNNTVIGGGGGGGLDNPIGSYGLTVTPPPGALDAVVALL